LNLFSIFVTIQSNFYLCVRFILSIILNTQDNELWHQTIVDQFVQDAHSWTVAAKSTVPLSGYLSEIYITRKFIEWVEPNVTERVAHWDLLAWIGRIRIERVNNIEVYDFEMLARDVAECVLDIGNRPFGLRYKIEGIVIQGEGDPAPFSRTIVRLVDKTFEKINAKLNRPIPLSLGGFPDLDTDNEVSDGEA
jgi:hypothetical protein